MVDDQELDRHLLGRILEANGFAVEAVETGAEAYEKCRRTQFDAITIDLVLGDQPGWDVLARIRSLDNYRNIPVIAISGCEKADLKVPLAVECFLTKPVAGEALLGALERVGLPSRKVELANG